MVVQWNNQRVCKSHGMLRGTIQSLLSAGYWWICASDGCKWCKLASQATTTNLKSFNWILQIDGELTLGENIADNGGMREAFYAYRLYVQRFGKEGRRLPGLEKYTHEQLFFISFGNLWCETYTPAASRYALEDSHCPGKIRLKGVLANSHEFADTFQCRRGTAMNPNEKKCKIW